MHLLLSFHNINNFPLKYDMLGFILLISLQYLTAFASFSASVETKLQSQKRILNGSDASFGNNGIFVTLHHTLECLLHRLLEVCGDHSS